MSSGTDGSSNSHPPEIARRIGTVVAGCYRLLRHIGSGSSSHVFAAEQTRLGMPVAVKILRSEIASNERAATRFRHEARAIARLRHEHVVSLFDYGELDCHTLYLVMELLEGEDLRQLLRREGKLPARRAVQIALEACRALEAVHAADVVHRDLKPENLFITRRSTGEDWCKVHDFGVAKLSPGHTTAQDALVGTIRYMAPEQLYDSRSVDETTDVYALGAVLYECLAGSAPCDAKTEPEMMYQIMNVDPIPLARRRPELPRALTNVVHAALSRDRAKRPTSMVDLARRLRAALEVSNGSTSDNATVADRVRPATPPASPARSSRSAIFALAVGCAALTGFALGRLGVADRGASPAASFSAHRTPEALPMDNAQRARGLARTTERASPPAQGAGPNEAALVMPSKIAARTEPRAPLPAAARALRRHDDANDDGKAQPLKPTRISGFDAANPYTD